MRSAPRNDRHQDCLTTGTLLATHDRACHDLERVGTLLFAYGQFGAFVIICTWAGVRLIQRAIRSEPPPGIPPANIANADGMEAAYATAMRIGAHAPSAIGRMLAFVSGIALIVAPWVILVFGLAIGKLGTP